MMTYWSSEVRLHIKTCCKCDVRFGMPDEIHAVALQQREKYVFYCPHGHPQHYTTGKTDKQEFRDERDRLNRQINFEKERREIAEVAATKAKRTAATYKGHVTKLKNRARVEGAV